MKKFFPCLLASLLLSSGSAFAAQAIKDLTLTGNTTLTGTSSINGTIASGTLDLSGLTLTLPIIFLRSDGSYADPAWITILAKSKVGLGNVENTALSTWAGTSSITTIGTLGAGAIPTTLLTGTITNAQLTNSAITIAGTSTSLGGSITQDTITGLASTGLVKRTGANALGIASAGTDYLSPTGAGTGLTGIPYSLTGTAGQVVLSAATGNITFSLSSALAGINSVIAASSTDLALTGGSSGASVVIQNGSNGAVVLTAQGSNRNLSIISSNATNTVPAGIIVRHATTATAAAGLGVALAFQYVDSSAANKSLATIQAVTSVAGAGSRASMTFQTVTNDSITEKARITDLGNLLVGTTTDMTGSGGLKVAGTTASTNTTTGSLINAGGFGNAGKAYFGDVITGSNDIISSSGAAGVKLSSASSTLGLIVATGTDGLNVRTSAGDQMISFAKSLSLSAWGTTGAMFEVKAQTFTDSSTAGSGTAATAVFSSFAVPTLAATNASVTTTNAATVYIAGAPAAGTNQTLTNSWGLWNAGKSRFDAAIVSNDATASSSTSTGAFIVNNKFAVSGATGNVFVGGDLNLSSNSSLIRGVFGDNTISNRTFFKSIAGNYTDVGILPGADAQRTTVTGFGDLSPANTSYASFGIDNTAGARVLIIESAHTGSGTTRPMSFRFDGVEKMALGNTGNLVVKGTLTTLGGATFHTTSTALTDGAGVALGTLATAPSAGNPTKWIGINDNGTTRYIPAW